MKKSISFNGTGFRRTLWRVGLLAAIGSFGVALAEDTRLDDSAKKVGNNFGELLKGMGQEVKKVGGSLGGTDKKSAKQKTESSSKENEQSKEKEQPN